MKKLLEDIADIWVPLVLVFIFVMLAQACVLKWRTVNELEINFYKHERQDTTKILGQDTLH